MCGRQRIAVETQVRPGRSEGSRSRHARPGRRRTGVALGRRRHAALVSPRRPTDRRHAGCPTTRSRMAMSSPPCLSSDSRPGTRRSPARRARPLRPPIPAVRYGARGAEREVRLDPARERKVGPGAVERTGEDQGRAGAEPVCAARRQRPPLLGDSTRPCRRPASPMTPVLADREGPAQERHLERRVLGQVADEEVARRERTGIGGAGPSQAQVRQPRPAGVLDRASGARVRAPRASAGHESHAVSRGGAVPADPRQGSQSGRSVRPMRCQPPGVATG